ncbi:hypothetical protein [Cellulosimicrobium cellulans]|uniref:hypothetical protein n=1 Tax=Cellulosimicrobium cellulans TaxID=1710 RepID=UPI0024066EFB|nr:hypothetical protein [Cellulosimicrobium cellulans]MDF9877917.1 hypothetical protein [Cellulosimicrobium cellulans]
MVSLGFHASHEQIAPGPLLGAARRAQEVRSVLARRSTWQEASMVTAHNLSPDPVVVRLALGELPAEARLVDLLDADDVEPDPDGSAEVRLDGYGYRWLRVTHPGSRRFL